MKDPARPGEARRPYGLFRPSFLTRRNAARTLCAMDNELGEALQRFAEALETFREGLAAHPDLCGELFEGAQEWVQLLTYKLVPHLAGKGCLVAALAGGTQTGKSTLLNSLLHEPASPVRARAAATRQPVLTANARRCTECLEGKLVPEFAPALLYDPEQALRESDVDERLFVVESPLLPDHLVLLDTPDIDSIDKRNWEVAENIRAVGDVVIALLTEEKYKDERVIEFFKKAHESGRMVVPVMNKVDEEDDEETLEAVREQLEDFSTLVGLDSETPLFIAPRNRAQARGCALEVHTLGGDGGLLAYLKELDVPAIKERVYGRTVRQFVAQSAGFIGAVEEASAGLRHVRERFRAATEHTHETPTAAMQWARRYNPTPGAAVGGLLHEFLQARRGRINRTIGKATRTVMRNMTAVRQQAWRLLAGGDGQREGPNAVEDALREKNAQQVRDIVRDLDTHYRERLDALPESARALIRRELDALNLDEVIGAVVKKTIVREDFSEDFREFAEKTLEDAWEAHPMRRDLLITLDNAAALAPAALVAGMAWTTAGIGGPEVATLAIPVLERLGVHTLLYVFGDQAARLMERWCDEQQRLLAEALDEYLCRPALSGVDALLEPLEGNLLDELRSCHNRVIQLCKDGE